MERSGVSIRGRTERKGGVVSEAVRRETEGVVGVRRERGERKEKGCGG